MAYAGLPPATFSNNLTNVQLVDDISGSFNGSTQTFALTSSSAPFHAVSARSLIVVLGGIVQKPQVDYTVDGANITFTVAPVAGLTFAARNIYGLNYLNNVNDGVITPAKLSTGGPSWNTGGTLTVSGDLNVVGSFNSGTQGLFWGDNEPANFGDGNDLKIYHSGSNSFIRDQGVGSLFIEGTDLTLRAADSTTRYLVANQTNGDVSLFYGNNVKLATTSTGVNITGTLKVNDISSLDSTTLSLGLEGGANGFINTQESLYVNIDSNNNETGKRFEIRHGATDASGTQLFTILDSGNVGIGTDNPASKLQVSSIGDQLRIECNAGAGAATYSELSRTLQLACSQENFGTYVVYSDIVANSSQYSENVLRFFTHAHGVSAPQERIRITGIGNVGIGTTNPDKKLRVEGDARITGTLTMGTASISINGAHEYPTIRPTLDLNFAATKTLDRRITFTRDSLGTYTDELGIVRYAPNNTPRFDHDPTTGESLGLLIEESRTNIIPYSTTYFGWTTYSSSTSLNTQETLAPDGTYTAVKIISTGTYSQFGFYEELSYSANTIYTHSMWLKAGTATRIAISVSSGTRWTTSPYLVVDLDTGTVHATGSSISTKLTAYPNGWYLLEATGEFGGTSQTDAIWSYTATTGGHSGDTTSYYYQWGGQVETGSFATSYIPTSGSTVTRAADFAKITGTNFTDFYNQTEGTFFIDSGIARGSSYVGYLGTGTSSAADSGPSYNFNAILSDDDNSDIVLDIFNGNVGAQAFISILNSTTQRHRIAGAYASNDFAISLNGSSPSTDPSGTADPNQDQFWIGRRPYTNAGWLNNSIKRVSYYNKRLPNAQLQGLTAQ